MRQWRGGHNLLRAPSILELFYDRDKEGSACQVIICQHHFERDLLCKQSFLFFEKNWVCFIFVVVVLTWQACRLQIHCDSVCNDKVNLDTLKPSLRTRPRDITEKIPTISSPDTKIGENILNPLPDSPLSCMKEFIPKLTRNFEVKCAENPWVQSED